MADRFKGITIEINGNTTKLETALKKVDAQTRKVDRELKKVDKALKFNPTSVNLWREKQKLLNEQVTQTKSKLDSLKQAQKKMDAEGVDKNSEQYRNLQREIALTEADLKKYERELRRVGNVKLKALSEQFKKVGTAIKTAGRNMTRYVSGPLAAGLAASTKAAMNYGDAIAKVSTIADESEVSIKDLSKGIMDLSNQTGKSSTELAEATYQALSASIDTKDALNFVRQASGLAKAGFLETAGAVDVLTTVINAYGMKAEDADKIANMLIQTQNDGKTTVDQLAESMGNVIPTASALNVPLEQLSASYVILTKQGINTNRSTTALNALFNELSKSSSGVSKILQNETGKTFGQLMAEGKSLGDILQMLYDSVDGDSEAFKNLFGNVRAGQGALALVNGGIENFNAEVGKMINSTGNVENALNDLATPGAAARKALTQLVNVGIQIGDVLAPYIQKAAEWIQKLTDKFNSLSPETKKTIVIVAGIVAAVGPLMTVIGGIISGVGALIGVIGMITAPMLGITAIIAAVIIYGIKLYKNWDTVKAKAIAFKNGVVKTFQSMKNTIVSVFNAIKNAITRPITTAVNIVKSAIEKIKNIINNAHLKLPKFKLPHFRIYGGKLPWGIGGKGTAPKISVDWYAKGGIFDAPSIIGVGEAGSEAVVPLDKFWDKLDQMQTGTNIVININGANKDPREIAEEVRRMLIKETNQRRLAWQ